MEEQVALKHRTEGFVYRAPNTWLFGRGRYYLVNQAAEIRMIRHPDAPI
jgi:hypothetical protein